MHIADAILHANSAGVVLFLLTSYVEAIRQDATDEVLPHDCVGHDYRHADEVARCLRAVVNRVAQRGEPAPDSIVGEAMHVFSAALNRLRQLEQPATSGAQSQSGAQR